MDSSNIHNHFNQLENAILSYGKLGKGKPRQFNKKKGVFRSLKPEALTDWNREVKKANRFIDREIAVITAETESLNDFQDRIVVVTNLAKDISKKLEKRKVSDPSEKAAIKKLKKHLESKIKELTKEETSESVKEAETNPEELFNHLIYGWVQPSDFLSKIQPFLDKPASLEAASKLADPSEYDSKLPPSITEEKEIKGLRESDLRKIDQFFQKHQKKILKNSQAKKPNLYLRKENTKLPVSIQVLPENDAGVSLIIHLRDETVLSLGSGADKKVRLSSAYTPGEDFENWDFYATATPLNEEKYEPFFREIEFLQLFKDEPGIIDLVTHCVYPAKIGKQKKHFQKIRNKLFKGKFKPNMVLAYAESDLSKKLAKGDIDPSDRKQKTLELLEGVSAVHAKNIIHHDLKPDNILISKGALKISDFSLARREDDLSSPIRGSHLYLAPEIWMAMDNKEVEGVIDSKADVFSLGLILYQMLNRALPVDGKIILTLKDPSTRYLIPQLIEAWHQEVLEALEKEIEEHGMTPDIKEREIILQMLNPNPLERITSSDALTEFIELYNEEL